jgi:hypothetical protein
MLSIFKKKEKVVQPENFMHANPQDFGWDLVGENDVNTTTIGSGEVSIKTEIRGKRIVIEDKKQSKRVESIIRENGAGMTPPQVHKVYESIYTHVPITSIRRAMTKLTDEGVLTMTGEKRMGDYNKTNFVWSLKNI